jgi:pantoate--beta-alanine ligase
MKDYQQALVIKKLTLDLNFDIEIIVCPTVREDDGLALSSRNQYLNVEERQCAPILYQALKLGESLILQGDRDIGSVKKQTLQALNHPLVAQIDYVSIVDPETLQDKTQITLPFLLALAVTIGKTRLIDNLLVA